MALNQELQRQQLEILELKRQVAEGGVEKDVRRLCAVVASKIEAVIDFLSTSAKSTNAYSSRIEMI